jgi:hypothetical protein
MFGTVFAGSGMRGLVPGKGRFAGVVNGRSEDEARTAKKCITNGRECSDRRSTRVDSNLVVSCKIRSWPEGMCGHSLRNPSMTATRKAELTETIEQRKARLMTAMEAAVDELLKWEEEAGKPNMTAIEEQVLALRQRLGVVMAQAVIDEQAARSGIERTVDAPRCAECGGPLVNKGRRTKSAVTRVGVLETDRPYACCPHCKRGVLPPGPAA